LSRNSEIRRNCLLADASQKRSPTKHAQMRLPAVPTSAIRILTHHSPHQRVSIRRDYSPAFPLKMCALSHDTGGPPLQTTRLMVTSFVTPALDPVSPTADNLAMSVVQSLEIGNKVGPRHLHRATRPKGMRVRKEFPTQPFVQRCPDHLPTFPLGRPLAWDGSPCTAAPALLPVQLPNR